MHAKVNIDGRIVDARDAVVSVLDHGFVYGEGVYETLRTYNRQPFLFEPHVTRLRASAAQIALDVPYSDQELLTRITQTVDALSATGEAYARVLLTRGVGELTYDPAACPTPTLVIIVKPLVEPPAHQFDEGTTVSLVSVVRNYTGSVHPRIKSNNLLNNALAMQEAIKHRATEALMRNYRGEIVECSLSNFFIVKNGIVKTPALECGLLGGITRQFLFEIGQELGLPFSEAILHDEDVFTADEAFLTSTTQEVTPVVRVDRRVIGAGTPGPITKQLLAEYRRRAQALTGTALTGERS